ncbi:aldehyde dehydrogenase [Croceicoccus bisphenolivorans]|uniref:aldehyde dehydrogenase n=1 Tax=Croceicoccus bisphenolivorans TaxID=1783232 RepID=UPI00082BAF94|nr:aldehyde dehydrogenase [Croceicoccus bisphenolivorans]
MTPNGVHIDHPDRLFIDGAWVPATSGRSFEIVSPNSEEVVARVAEGCAQDMDAAVAAARRAFDHGPWPRTAPRERARMVAELAKALRARSEELENAWIEQIGGLPGMARGVVATGNRSFADIAELGDRFPWIEEVAGETVDSAYIVREPVGVVAAIAPWNSPYMIMANKVAYSLIAGCTLIMKPAPETPLEAYIIAEEAAKIGFPPGVLNLVTADRDVADRLVSSPAVDKVSFTGSTAVGMRIAQVCGSRIARCSLELGGKSAAIIRDDMPTGEAAQLLGTTITRLSGQICAMLTRAIVPADRHDEMAEAIADVMRGIKIGHSREEGVQLGPLAMKRQLERVESYIEEGRATADLVHGGQRPAHLNKGYFIEPTLFANVDSGSRIAQEEIFGPVLCLIPAKDEADAIRIANDSNFGLHGSVLTKDADAAFRIAREMRTGMVGQNGMRTQPGMPFGGFKQSGIGREGGAEGLLPYIETKSILLDGRPSDAALGN